MVRQIISKWGVLSQELTDGFEKDSAVVYQDGSYEIADIGLGVEDTSPIIIETTEENKNPSDEDINKQGVSDDTENAEKKNDAAPKNISFDEI